MATASAAKQPRVKLPAIPWVAIGSVIGVLVVAGGLVSAGRWVLNRPVERVVINGEFERVSADQLEAVLRKAMGKGFLAADLDAIQAKVAALPWVATARVSRQWPDTLDVTVTEEEPAARWGADGLLNPQGRLFVRHTSHIPAELPRLNGPEGSEAEVAARYVAIQEQLVERGPCGRRPSSWTDAAPGRSCSATASACASVPRTSRPGSRASSKRWIRWCTPVAADVQFVDMRYTNGFSIGWKQQRAAQRHD